MAIFIALQTPTVTLPVKSNKDCAGLTAKLFAEFKRYGSDEADEKIAALDAIIHDEAAKIFSTDSEEIKAEKKLLQKRNSQAIRDFIKGEIVSLQKIPLLRKDDDTGKVTPFEVSDTRNAKDNTELWGEASNCLDFLLDMLLASTPWSSSFITALYSVLTNMNLGAAAEVKNY